jgi:hypothetical protein
MGIVCGIDGNWIDGNGGIKGGCIKGNGWIAGNVWAKGSVEAGGKAGKAGKTGKAGKAIGRPASQIRMRSLSADINSVGSPSLTIVAHSESSNGVVLG